ncbi:MAG: hypothetical protein AAFP77_16100 [Bacteroidota bacterium]
MNVAEGSALYHAVKDNTDIWSAINGAFFPNILPEYATYPAIVWGQLTDDITMTKDGPVKNGQLFQLDIYGKDYGTVQQIALLLKNKMMWLHLEVPNLGLCEISYSDQGDATPIPDKGLLHIIQDYRVRVKRPA